MTDATKTATAKVMSIFRGILQLVDVFLLLVSPLMVIGFLIGVIMLLSEYGEHRQFVRRMESSGLVAEGTVDLVSPDYGWIFVEFTDDNGEVRSNVLEMAYYPDSMWDELMPDSPVTIRYLPYAIPGSDRVVLQDRFEDVQGYRGYLSGDLIGLLIVCWLALLVKPQILYVGMIDPDSLMKEGLT